MSSRPFQNRRLPGSNLQSPNRRSEEMIILLNGESRSQETIILSNDITQKGGCWCSLCFIIYFALPQKWAHSYKTSKFAGHLVAY